jgi:hypothetical protein
MSTQIVFLEGQPLLLVGIVDFLRSNHSIFILQMAYDNVSQLETHVCTVCNLPLGSTKMKVPVAAMVNVLGSETMSTTMESSTVAVHGYNGKLE